MVFKLFSRKHLSTEQVVAFYHRLGFFRREAGAPLSQITQELLSRFEDETGEAYDPRNPWDDKILLSFDRDRVWTDDPEANVAHDTGVYREVLREWSSVSLGSFDPVEIEEKWDTELGPVSVTFLLDGHRKSISPQVMGEYIDLNILHQINELIAGTGRRFDFLADVNHAVVFSITPEQRDELSRVRKHKRLSIC